MMRHNTYVTICTAPNCNGSVQTNAAQPRMMYSSSKEAIKRALNGLAADIQANDADDLEFENIKTRVSKGR